jgi:hypothetical protein
LCTYLGIATHPEYNRRFAQYADAINPIVINYHVVLSVNPLDYLTMSFGNSWASCHTIDKANKRGMPNSYSGMYSSGTMSYLLDGTSVVLYTVDEKYSEDEYWSQPKINRQMFHYFNNKLIQSRLYPQSNDGDGSVYTPYRNIVQEIIATIFEIPNLWTNKKGTSEICNYVWSHGTHYRDYQNFNSCNISLAKDTDITGTIKIGHNPICIECGNEHHKQRNINCCSGAEHTCTCCGYDLDDDEDEIVYVNGYPYCRDCVSWCDDCEEYYLNDDVHYVEYNDRYVCERCLRDDYIWCPHCEQYIPRCDATYIHSTGDYVCENCLSEHYTMCDECEEYFPVGEVYEHNYRYLCDSCAKKEDEEE